MANSVRIIASPDKVRLLIDDNIKHEDEIIPYDVLLTHLEKSINGVKFHYEWTADLNQWDKDNLDTFEFTPDIEATTVISIGEPLEEDEDECEHLHIEDVGYRYGTKRVECLDCGEYGYIAWETV